VRARCPQLHHIITTVDSPVSSVADRLKASLEEKGFTIFCDVDHQKNAAGVDLEMPESRVLIFGNPIAGTKLMQKDITMSLDLPLRIAVVDRDGKTEIIHQTTENYISQYDVNNHPVLDKVEALFAGLISEVSA